VNKLANQELFNKAIDILNEMVGTCVFPVNNNNINYIGEGDDTIQVEIKRGGVVEELTAIVFAHLTQEKLGVVEQKVLLQNGKTIVVTKYVAPQMADKLREKGINFLDTAGNALLDTKAFYVFVKGNKPQTEIVLKVMPHRLFKPGGLKVIFALLCKPGLENAPFREIALRGGVALGTVGKVMQDLKDLGYLHDMGGKGRLLKKKEQLLGKWVEEYPIQLMPKQHYGYFTAMDDDWLEKINLTKYKAVWGGEIAAAMLTDYLKTQGATIYIKDEPGKLIIENKFKKDPNGNIEIRNCFWDFTQDDDIAELLTREVAPPILVYADLLATGDTRNIETAKIIYDQTIFGFIGEAR
jgi:hypothetical protein